MDRDFRDWLNNFNAVNGLNDNGEPRGTMSQPARAHSRKRLGKILDGDPLAIIVTNRKARIGIRQDRISR